MLSILRVGRIENFFVSDSLGEIAGGFESTVGLVEAPPTGEQYTPGVHGLGRIAEGLKQGFGAVVVAAAEGGGDSIEPGFLTVGIIAEGGFDDAVEFVGALGIETCDAHHLVERHFFGRQVDDFGELFVGRGAQTCADAEIGGAELREPLGQDSRAIEGGQLRIGLHAALAGVVVGGSVGRAVDDLEKERALSVGDAVGLDDDVAQLGPVLGHGAVVGASGGQLVSSGEIFGKCARTAGGKLLVVDIGRLGRSIAGDLDLGNLDVGVGEGVADGVVDDGELGAVIDELSVAAAVGHVVELGAVDLKLNAGAAFVDRNGELGHLGGNVCDTHHGGGIEHRVVNVAESLSGLHSAATGVVDEAEAGLVGEHPFLKGNGGRIFDGLRTAVVAAGLCDYVIAAEHVGKTGHGSALVSVVHVASGDKNRGHDNALSVGSGDDGGDEDLSVVLKVERVEHDVGHDDKLASSTAEVDSGGGDGDFFLPSRRGEQ